MPRLIRSAVLNNYMEIARSVGLDPYHMIAQFGLPAACLTDSEIRVSADKIGRLLEASAQRSGKVDFGLRLAEGRTLSNVGAFALLVREQPTIRKALEVLVGYMFLHSESLHFDLQEQDGLIAFTLTIEVDSPIPIRQSVELGFGFVHRSFAQLLRERWKPLAVWITATTQATIGSR